MVRRRRRPRFKEEQKSMKSVASCRCFGDDLEGKSHFLFEEVSGTDGPIEKEDLNSGASMNQNLDLLRHDYCRPTIVTGKGTPALFPLERECQQGKTLLAKAPKTPLHLQEFTPYGLHQTYREEKTGI